MPEMTEIGFPITYREFIEGISQLDLPVYVARMFVENEHAADWPIYVQPLEGERRILHTKDRFVDYMDWELWFEAGIKKVILREHLSLDELGEKAMEESMRDWKGTDSKPEPLAPWEQYFLVTGEVTKDDPPVGCFPSRGAYYLFVRGFLNVRSNILPMPHLHAQPAKYFRFVGAFPPGEQWTHICWMMEDLFGEENVVYRFGARRG